MKPRWEKVTAVDNRLAAILPVNGWTGWEKLPAVNNRLAPILAILAVNTRLAPVLTVKAKQCGGW